MSKLNKSLILILIIFHSVGLIGMVYFNRADFVRLSWLNILISSMCSINLLSKKAFKVYASFFIGHIF